MDLATISSAYSSLKAIKELGAWLLDAKIDAEAKKRVAEVLEKLGSVQDTLFFIREELIRIQDENQNLKNQISALQKELETKGKVVYEKPSYWVVENDQKDGPFCQRCYDAENKLLRLQGGKNDVWHCHQCGKTYYGPNYQPPQPRGGGGRGSSWLSI